VGADHETATCPLPLVPITVVGAPGILSGVTAEDAVDALELPTELVAITVNVYGVPFVNPVTVAVVPDDVVACKPPGLDVTVYKVIVAPPLELGADHDTTICPSPTAPDTPVGAPGIVNWIRESTNPNRLNTIVLQLSDKHGVRKP